MGALIRQAKKLAEDELPAIVAKMIEMAKAGDMMAASFIVSRFIPIPKPTVSDPLIPPCGAAVSWSDARGFEGIVSHIWLTL